MYLRLELLSYLSLPDLPASAVSTSWQISARRPIEGARASQRALGRADLNTNTQYVTSNEEARGAASVMI